MKVTGRSPLIFTGLCVSVILFAIGLVGYKTRQYAIYLSSVIEGNSERIESRAARIESRISFLEDRLGTRSDGIVRAASQFNGDFVLVLGDSIVAGSSLPPRVCDIPILNGGLGGARASTLLPLLEDISVSAKPPKLIIVAVGVNNSATAYWDQRAFEVSYSELLRKALSMSRVAVATVTPIDFTQEVGKTLNAADRDNINQFIIATAKQFNLDVIRLDQLSTKEPLTVDGVHLAGEAKDLWLSKVVSEATFVLGCSNSVN